LDCERSASESLRREESRLQRELADLQVDHNTFTELETLLSESPDQPDGDPFAYKMEVIQHSVRECIALEERMSSLESELTPYRKVIPGLVARLSETWKKLSFTPE
jgi:hypothetical protein